MLTAEDKRDIAKIFRNELVHYLRGPKTTTWISPVELAKKTGWDHNRIAEARRENHVKWRLVPGTKQSYRYLQESIPRENLKSTHENTNNAGSDGSDQKF